MLECVRMQDGTDERLDEELVSVADDGPIVPDPAELAAVEADIEAQATAGAIEVCPQHQQGDVIRELKAQGLKNNDPAVKKEVETLLASKAQLQEESLTKPSMGDSKLIDIDAGMGEYGFFRVWTQEQAVYVEGRPSYCHVGAASCLQAKIDEAAEKEEERLALLQAEQNEETLRLEGPVWMLRTQCMRFDCPEGRPQVKALAAQLAAKFCVVPTKKASKKKKKLVPYADDDEAY
eukprot:1188220-Prorocentrum_minimum.AAC.3